MKEIFAQKTDIKKVRYEIINGIFEDMNSEEKQVLDEFNRKQTDLVIKSWDLIPDNITNIKT